MASDGEDELRRRQVYYSVELLKRNDMLAIRVGYIINTWKMIGEITV